MLAHALRVGVLVVASTGTAAMGLPGADQKIERNVKKWTNDYAPILFAGLGATDVFGQFSRGQNPSFLRNIFLNLSPTTRARAPQSVISAPPFPKCIQLNPKLKVHLSSRGSIMIADGKHFDYEDLGSSLAALFHFFENKFKITHFDPKTEEKSPIRRGICPAR